MTSRRKFFKTIGASAAGIGLATVFPITACTDGSRSSQSTSDDEQKLFVGDDIAIADTQYGKVQGFILNDIFQFRGIPYGADTSGKNRFMPPLPPEAWDGIKPAVWWGNSAPQNMNNRYANQWASFVDCWNYDDVSEDCLKLNIWTPALNGKRPVLVWLHGGGYAFGNGIEQEGYKGENLSRTGDIVFVSINHRLGAIGFSDLSAVGGEKYAHSGNVGALDMVAALEWVRNNIAQFGGDPDNVTIMGQSGGGAKVCVLANMPKARGLFHKAVSLSGSSLEALNQDYSRKLGEYILKEAGLKPAEVDKLQDIPWNDYLQLCQSAARKASEELGSAGMRGGFSPVADGIHVLKGKFFSQADGLSANVPMLICTTFHEWNMSRTNPELEAISKEGAINMLATGGIRGGGLGDKAQAVFEAYARLFPKANPAEVLSLISSNRKSAIAAADAKSLQQAPVYLAWFGWEPPLFNNRMRAFHCLDICFWFANTDLMITHTGGGKRPRQLAGSMSTALLQFMRTGKPQAAGMPEWKPYTTEYGETMILNDVCELQNDHDREARNLL